MHSHDPCWRDWERGVKHAITKLRWENSHESRLKLLEEHNRKAARYQVARMAAHKPEDDYPRPLLKAVLSFAISRLELISRHGELPDGAGTVLHESDSEGRQMRRDAESGEACS